MGICTSQLCDARDRPAANRTPGAGAAACGGTSRGWRKAVYGVTLAIAGSAAGAETSAPDTLRIATYSAAFSRDGPGLLLRDLRKGDEQVQGAVAVIADTRPDILLLTEFDYDQLGMALFQLQLRLEAEGLDYPHTVALRPNTGIPTGFDTDQDGRLGEPEDNQGYGRFSGDGGMVLLSRHPITAVEDFSHDLWRDQPENRSDGLMELAHAAVQRLSSTGHWRVRIGSNPEVTLIALAATAPVFDGPEDFNGKRNADELALARAMLDGVEAPVVLGRFNLDPVDGEGLHDAVLDLLRDPRLQDPEPRSPGAAQAADPTHHGNPALDTADWPEGTPGNLRVDYVLPSAQLRVASSGVVWPESNPLADHVATAGAHRMVWVDLQPP